MNFLKAELPDKLYCTYLVIYSQWISLESDNYEKMKICEYANNNMKPMTSLSSNIMYAPFLPVYRLSNPDCTKSILSNRINTKHLTKVRYVKLKKLTFEQWYRIKSI